MQKTELEFRQLVQSGSDALEAGEDSASRANLVEAAKLHPRLMGSATVDITEDQKIIGRAIIDAVKNRISVLCRPDSDQPVFEDDVMGQLLRFVSAHEVGHTLGFQHNMDLRVGLKAFLKAA